MNWPATFFMVRPSRHLGCMPPVAASGCMTVLAIRRCNSRNSRAVWRLGGDGFVFKIFNELIGFKSLVMHFVKGGNPGVPFQERGRFAHPRNGALVELPNRIEHRMVVSVEKVLLVFGMAGNVKLRHPLR